MIGIVVQMTYNLAIAESTQSFGPFETAMIIMIPGIALFLIWYTMHASKRGWIS